tara:strand:+ start:180 stop:548 length:369 start_codon:yes stop_codon:yes gene_type:complete
MATLVTKLTLTSSNATSDTLNLSQTDTLTTANPTQGLTRVSITSGNSLTVVAAGDAGSVYLYAKNTNTSGTGKLILANAAGQGFGVLNNDEFAFFPIDRAKGFNFEANTADVVVEYGYFTKG